MGVRYDLLAVSNRKTLQVPSKALSVDFQQIILNRASERAQARPRQGKKKRSLPAFSPAILVREIPDFGAHGSAVPV